MDIYGYGWMAAFSIRVRGLVPLFMDGCERNLQVTVGDALRSLFGFDIPACMVQFFL
jgi:hypothetical protein